MNGDPGRVLAKTILKIRVERHSAGSGQGLETQALQIAGATDIPGVRDSKTAPLMDRSECLALLGRAALLTRYDFLSMGRASYKSGMGVAMLKAIIP
jgi:hypothetical protein